MSTAQQVQSLSKKKSEGAGKAGQQKNAHTVREPVQPTTPVRAMLQRQQTIGNQAVLRLLRSGGLQAKLKINQQGDMYEQEADRVADQVMATPAHPTHSGAPPRIQRFSGQSHGQADAVPASVDQVLTSPGRPLEPGVQQDMEQRFGYDFSRVRVHSGAAAEQSAQDVNANAYTVGHNIVFGAGTFTPETRQGRRLIAHELSHVVQQSGSDGIRFDQGREKRSLSAIGTRQSSVPLALQRAPKGPVRVKSYRCTGVALVRTRITFYGNHGPISATVQPIDIPPGTYKVRAGDEPGSLLIVASSDPTVWSNVSTKVLTYSWNVKGSEQQIAAFEEKLMGYVESMTAPVALTVKGTSARSSGVSESVAEPGEPGTGGVGGERDVPTPEGGSGERQEKSGTGTTGPGTERQPSGTGGEQGGTGEKISAEYEAKLKALLDGSEAKQLDADQMRQLKSILDNMSLDDIALFKQFAVKNPGGDMEGFLQSLRLFVSTKEVYEKQQPPKAETPDESQKILADAMRQYRDDMSQDAKEALARATVEKLSNEQLRNLTPAQIAESIVRVDQQLKGMGEDTAGGVNDAIKGTGWERVAGVARGVKGAANFWAFLSFAALIAASFIPGLNVLVLTTSAFAAVMVAYAAAHLQQQAEIKLAGTAKSSADFQKHSMAGAAARTEVIIMTIGMALPIAGKLIGKLPLPGGLKNVSTALQAARNTLRQGAGKAFASAKASVLEALSKANGDLQPYIMQFRQNIASITQRLRGASGPAFLKEIQAVPELQGVVSAETAKALQGLSASELELAKKGIIEALDTAPAVAEETLKNIQTELRALERDVQATTSAQQLESVLAQGTKTADPQRLITSAGEKAVEEVVQSRVSKLADIEEKGAPRVESTASQTPPIKKQTGQGQQTATKDVVAAEAQLKSTSAERIKKLEQERVVNQQRIDQLNKEIQVWRQVSKELRQEANVARVNKRPTAKGQELINKLTTPDEKQQIAQARKSGKSAAEIQENVLLQKARESDGIVQRLESETRDPIARNTAAERDIRKLQGIIDIPDKAGGSYNAVSAKSRKGYSEANHLPAKDAYLEHIGLSEGEGPAIWMTKEDHMKTASWGNGRDAQLWRQKQRELIEQGKYMEAMEMDIQDIRTKFPDGRYEKGIWQAQEYAKGLDPSKLKPKSGVKTTKTQ